VESSYCFVGYILIIQQKYNRVNIKVQKSTNYFYFLPWDSFKGILGNNTEVSIELFSEL